MRYPPDTGGDISLRKSPHRSYHIEIDMRIHTGEKLLDVIGAETNITASVGGNALKVTRVT